MCKKVFFRQLGRVTGNALRASNPPFPVLFSCLIALFLWAAPGQVRGQIGSALLPDYNIPCGKFNIIIEPNISPTTCPSCCVSPSCTQAVYRVKLAISTFGLPIGAYNNGNFDLLYRQLSITVQALVAQGELTKINKQATEDCTGGVLNPVDNHTLFQISANEADNSASLDLSTAYIGEPGEILPVITFNNYQTGWLFSLVVDFYPGEVPSIFPQNFLYTDANSVSCSTYSVNISPNLPAFYPSPSTTNNNFTLALGSSVCGAESAGFPVNMTSTGGAFNLLDFSITIATTLPLAQKPTFQVASGRPTPVVEYEDLPSGGGYVMHFTYTSATLSGSGPLVTILAEPELFTAGYFISAKLSGGRALTTSGCGKPAIGNDFEKCSANGLTPCTDYTLSVASQSAGFGSNCSTLKVYAALSGPQTVFNVLHLRFDFVLDPGVTITNASVDNMTCPGSTCMVSVTGNRVELNSTAPITWGSNSYVFVEFNAPNGCIQDVWVRKAEITPAGASTPCYPTVTKATFPYCTNQLKGHIALEGPKCYVPDVRIEIFPEDDPSACGYTENSTCGPYSQCVCADHKAWTIIPTKDKERLDGVSTLDLVSITKHILGLSPLASPYYMIAADANQSGSITTFDIVALRKLILGIYNDDDTDPTNDWPSAYARSWRFVPKAFVFPNVLNPFQTFFPEFLSGQTLPTLNADFIAIKVGHAVNVGVPGNPGPLNICADCTAPMRPAPVADFNLAAPSDRVGSGEYYTLPIYAQTNAPLTAWQMGLRFDTRSLEFVGMSAADLPNLTDDNFGLTQVSEGIIRVLWIANLTHEEEYVRPGQRLFYLTFRAKRDVADMSLLLRTDDEILASLGWQNDESAYRMLINADLSVKDRGSWEAGNKLQVQCRPNPSADGFTFDMNLLTPDVVQLAVYDAFGRRMIYREMNLEAGSQSVQVPEASAWPAGVYRWDIRAGKTNHSKGHAVKL